MARYRHRCPEYLQALEEFNQAGRDSNLILREEVECIKDQCGWLENYSAKQKDVDILSDQDFNDKWGCGEAGGVEGAE